MPDDNLGAGWTFLAGAARKAHYFAEGETRSLCGKWGRFNRPDAGLEPETGPSIDDCAACRRKLDKEPSGV